MLADSPNKRQAVDGTREGIESDACADLSRVRQPLFDYGCHLAREKPAELHGVLAEASAYDQRLLADANTD